MSRRVLITGLGVASPIGIGKTDFWRSICDGRTGIEEIKAFDTSSFDTHRGGEIFDFQPEQYFQRLDPTKVPRTTQLAVATARMAWEDAGSPALSEVTSSVCFGTTMGNQSLVETTNDQWRQGLHELQLPAATYTPAYIAQVVALELGTSGPFLVLPTACAAGNYAIGWGYELIRSGRAEIVIAGGADALSRGCYAVFHSLKAMAPQFCQPFDRNRRGMLVSEGAGVLILESEDHVRKRGGKAYAELLSYALSCDAYHATAPHPNGAGASAAMLKALDRANCAPEEVSYISAHGTGTKANDVTESMAVRSVFGDHVDSIPVSSIKSMIGHTMGAASAIEAVVSVLSIHHGILPPTRNFEELDPECLSNVVPNEPQIADVNVVLSNSFGFGGNIATIVLKRL